MAAEQVSRAQVTRVQVTVTFLRMDAPPATPAVPLPAGFDVTIDPAPTVGFYRHLYDGVGADYLWWLRRTISDRELAGILSSPAFSLHVLRDGTEPAGFFELERRASGDINLSYFGLLPAFVGRRLGTPFLRVAIDRAWSSGAWSSGAWSSGAWSNGAWSNGASSNGTLSNGAWSNGASGVTVNTCTADHPRALPGYLNAGFRPVRSVHETWNIPTRLGLPIPAALRT